MASSGSGDPKDTPETQIVVADRAREELQKLIDTATKMPAGADWEEEAAQEDAVFSLGEDQRLVVREEKRMTNVNLLDITEEAARHNAEMAQIEADKAVRLKEIEAEIAKADAAARTEIAKVEAAGRTEVAHKTFVDSARVTTRPVYYIATLLGVGGYVALGLHQVAIAIACFGAMTVSAGVQTIWGRVKKKPKE